MENHLTGIQPKNSCSRCGHEHPTAAFVTWPNGRCLYCPDQPKPKIRGAADLWDVQICAGKEIKETLHYRVQRGIAENKKKELIEQGTIERNIWIVRSGTEAGANQKK